jgi:hypothetical protein
MQTLVNLLGIDADSDAGQLLMAALGLRRIVMDGPPTADLARGGTDREDSSGGDAEDENDEEVNMEIDEI